ncbi:MAG: MFS transporter [Brevibacterium aurantiacum]|uniref:Benzoate transport n=3 Tax=Brevibacteriaceae TaxID=85019 RepID=A0A2A3X6R4_BREAU|nr:MFS transporter [Brevibacterium aurantiacum]MDN5607124.1 MFS transporter [Brevibacterium sp.]MDN5660478.1 MFS transporter [Brevibacterium aurantiacum]PCC19465.1 MFS transporter [Brevibacterium aurantiacum]PCC44509.1 MFS transporter [Brevibacterium aurantiacum]
MDLRERLNTSRMSTYQWLIVGICTFLNALDGYDVLAISFTSNQVSEEFSLSGTALGLVMSAALLGMAIGALTLGPVADRIGRRNMTIIALIVNICGLFLSATATSATELGIWRIVTGLGIGGILVGTNVICAEYASRKRRGLVISIYTAGYGIGAALGGSVMVSLIATSGWRSVFILGGCLATLSLVLVLLLVPGSPSYLYNRRPENAVKKLTLIARRLGHTEPVDLNATTAEQENKADDSGVLALFNRRNRRVTFVVWATFFIVMFGFYFVNSWTPRLMNESGLTDTLSMIVTVGLTLGGAIGSVAFGLFTSRWSTRSVLMSFSVLAAILMAVFIFTAQWIVLVIVVGVLVGMFSNGCIAGLYVLTPQSYSSSLRSTGVGWGIGIGRFGAIIAPTATGAMLDGGWSPQAIYVFVGVVLLLAAVVLLGMRGVDVEANRKPEIREGAAV